MSHRQLALCSIGKPASPLLQNMGILNRRTMMSAGLVRKRVPGCVVPHSRYLELQAYPSRQLPRRVEDSDTPLAVEPETDPLPIPTFTEGKIKFKDMVLSPFHLRDHCRCRYCCHPETAQRTLDTFSIPDDIAPIDLCASKLGLHITWPGTPKEETMSSKSGEDAAAVSVASNEEMADNVPTYHESFYPTAFLRKLSPGPKPPTTSQFLVDHSICLWSDTEAGYPVSKSSSAPPSVQFSDLIESDDVVRKALGKVAKFGVVFVEGVPVNPEETEKACRRLGVLRNTHYGEFWDFTADFKHGDLAYSNQALPPHTDTTYFTDPCGLQIFHLLSHPPPGTGGTTVLVDSFAVAKQLFTLDPAAYHTLSSSPTPAHAAGTPGSIFRPSPLSGFPVLNHDSKGNLYQTRWNNEDRSLMEDLGDGKVEEWYRAAKIWEGLLRKEENQWWLQLKPGTMVVLNNWRLMHGRSAFTGERRMCGAYIGQDEWLSRWTALREKMRQEEGSIESNTVWNKVY